jgi:hypothetical protein
MASSTDTQKEEGQWRPSSTGFAEDTATSAELRERAERAVHKTGSSWKTLSRAADDYCPSPAGISKMTQINWAHDPWRGGQRPGSLWAPNAIKNRVDQTLRASGYAGVPFHAQ